MRRPRMTILCLTGILAGVVLAFATWRSPAPAPVEVRVLNCEPAGILDEDGVEMRLVTFRVTKSSRYQEILKFQPNSTKVWIEVSSHWREFDDPPDFSIVAQNGTNVWGGTREIVLLMPTAATRCRVRLGYAGPSIGLRAGWALERSGIKPPRTYWLWAEHANWLWRKCQIEIRLPDSRPLPAPSGAHNKASQTTAVFAFPLVLDQVPAASEFFR
jgi:hypothetical protein